MKPNKNRIKKKEKEMLYKSACYSLAHVTPIKFNCIFLLTTGFYLFRTILQNGFFL